MLLRSPLTTLQLAFVVLYIVYRAHSRLRCSSLLQVVALISAENVRQLLCNVILTSWNRLRVLVRLVILKYKFSPVIGAFASGVTAYGDPDLSAL